MRTTIEITEGQHRALASVAQHRGLRGFSPLVQEALDSYLRDLGDDELDLLLSLEGILDEGDEQEVRARVDEARATWRSG